MPNKSCFDVFLERDGFQALHVARDLANLVNSQESVSDEVLPYEVSVHCLKNRLISSSTRSSGSSTVRVILFIVLKICFLHCVKLLLY